MRPVVIGIAGGIGSGKSAVAGAFASLGLLVSDSDTEAKAQLEIEEVRDELVRWWGTGVLDAGGVVDRASVARIVFADDAERARLESLIHPRLRAGREAMIQRARDGGMPGVVIDAPLLFEAGIDAECDAVVFVEAPREVRLERVRRTRGWDEAELGRRESAQWPLDQKRDACGHVIRNDRSESALKQEASRVLDEVRWSITRSSGG
ncbi:MAG: dephospho-CoA kinase [Planctomycetota bacterium]